MFQAELTCRCCKSSSWTFWDKLYTWRWRDNCNSQSTVWHCALVTGRARGNQGGWAYLDRTGHGAQGEERGTVLDGGLTVKHSLSVHQQDSHLRTDRGRTVSALASVWACVRLCVFHLAAVWLVDHEHLAPGQDASGLPLTAASPAEARQRLLVPTNPGTWRLGVANIWPYKQSLLWKRIV